MRTNRPYVQLDPAVIEQARQMDLPSYLQRYETNNLKRVASNVYCTKEHDSLKISNGKWYCREISEAFLPLIISLRLRNTAL